MTQFCVIMTRTYNDSHCLSLLFEFLLNVVHVNYNWCERFVLCSYLYCKFVWGEWHSIQFTHFVDFSSIDSIRSSLNQHLKERQQQQQKEKKPHRRREKKTHTHPYGFFYKILYYLSAIWNSEISTSVQTRKKLEYYVYEKERK